MNLRNLLPIWFLTILAMLAVPCEAAQLGLIPWLTSLAATPQQVPSLPSPPTANGILFDGSGISIARAEDQTVTKLSTSDGTVQVSFTVGKHPSGLAFDGENVWVTDGGANTVTKIRGDDGKVLGTFAVGLYPVAVLCDGANLWVANSDTDTITKLRAEDGKVLGTLEVGVAP